MEPKWLLPSTSHVMRLHPALGRRWGRQGLHLITEAEGGDAKREEVSLRHPR